MPTPTAHPDGAVSTRRRRRRNQGITAIIATVVAAAGITVALRGNDAGDTAGTLSGVQFTQVSAGDDHVIALDSTGRIWSWGGNSMGQLGNGQGQPVWVAGGSSWDPGPDVEVPVRIDTGSTRFVSVVAGRKQSGAIDTDGKVWRWGARAGANQCEQNDVCDDNSALPVRDVSFVFFGVYDNDRISDVAEIELRGAKLFLRDISGQVYESPADGAYFCNDVERVEHPCPEGVDFKSISAGPGFVVGLGTEDRLRGWGRDWDLDDPPALDNWKQAEVGEGHVVALRRDGTLWTWGDNVKGQLCLGNRTASTAPNKVTEQVAPASALNDIIRVEANDERTVVLNKWGIAWMCGTNSSGELGIGNTTDQTTFQRVGDTLFSSISLGSDSLGSGFTVAIDTDGHIWTWGSDSSGQLGNGAAGSTMEEMRITG